MGGLLSVLSQQHKGARTQSVEHRWDRLRTEDISVVGAAALWDRQARLEAAAAWSSVLLLFQEAFASHALRSARPVAVRGDAREQGGAFPHRHRRVVGVRRPGRRQMQQHEATEQSGWPR